MLAVKAKYENGTVRWKHKPPVVGRWDLTIVFEAEDAHVRDPMKHRKASDVDHAIQEIQRCYADIPESVSLVDELIAERRREALNE